MKKSVFCLEESDIREAIVEYIAKKVGYTKKEIMENVTQFLFFANYESNSEIKAEVIVEKINKDFN